MTKHQRESGPSITLRTSSPTELVHSSLFIVDSGKDEVLRTPNSELRTILGSSPVAKSRPPADSPVEVLFASSSITQREFFACGLGIFREGKLDKPIQRQIEKILKSAKKEDRTVRYKDLPRDAKEKIEKSAAAGAFERENPWIIFHPSEVRNNSPPFICQESELRFLSAFGVGELQGVKAQPDESDAGIYLPSILVAFAIQSGNSILLEKIINCLKRKNIKEAENLSKVIYAFYLMDRGPGSLIRGMEEDIYRLDAKINSLFDHGPGEQTARRIETIKLIISSIKELLGLTKEFIEIAFGACKDKPFKIKDILTETVTELKKELEAVGKPLPQDHIKVSGANVVLQGVPLVLKRIWRELIFNAVKYGKQGHEIKIEIKIEGKKAAVTITNQLTLSQGQWIEEHYGKDGSLIGKKRI
ncbi:MAG: ATP-binding protein [Candidatus Omnitrophica bacterium]|nr:ATP-binding protein [Candidatus Omnitrophota bacterium]